MNYLFDADLLTEKTQTNKQSLAENKPDADFVTFAAGVIYDRLKKDIQRYRVYGMYWWALKDVMSRNGYDLGLETDDIIAGTYKGGDDAETIVAADMFYLEMSDQVTVTNTKWTTDNRKPDFVLYDADMEERNDVNETTLGS
jgi:hypothetical protein